MPMPRFSTTFAPVFCLALLACGPQSPPPAVEIAAPTPALPNTLTPAEAAEGWELLFDGQSTSKWRGYNQTNFPAYGWGIKDGELQVYHSGTEEAGAGGDIITRDSFTDFILSVDYALSDTANSGIFYLVTESPNTPIWHQAPEFQLLDDNTYRQIMDLTDKQYSGANYDMHPQTKDHSKPLGEWNTARIEKRGLNISHYLNDSLVVAYTLYDADWLARYQASKFAQYPAYARASTAAIGLQDHGHLVRFRNLKIKRL
ncbi:MAG: DUF1080 domain-containing protein [Lewinella sp.]|nr:DUF1080 domain-containing protein [Lewinella sp.]